MQNRTKTRRVSTLALAGSIGIIVSLIAVLAGVYLFYSPTYTYTSSVGGLVENNSDNGSTWNSTALSGEGSAHWYCRFRTTQPGYAGTVVVVWQLQKFVSPSWQNVTGASVTTTTNLSGSSGQSVYATTTGTTQSGNKDWVSHFTGSGQYRVEVEFNY